MYPGKVCLLAVVLSALSSAEFPPDIAGAIRQGQALQSQGRFSEAERQFRVAARQAGQLTDRNDVLATALSNLASIEIDLARFDEAARLYERGIAILVKQVGEDDPHVQSLRIQVAELYLEANQIPVAEKIVRTVIAHQQTRAMDNDSALALDVLACVYAHRKKTAAAENAERQALSILETLTNADPANLAIATLHMASFLDLRKRPAEALPLAERTIAMLKALPVPQPAMEATAEIGLASIYSRLHCPDEAESASEAGRQITLRFYGPNHPKTGEILLAQAAVLRTIGRKQAARQAQSQAEAIFARGGRAIGTVPLQALFP